MSMTCRGREFGVNWLKRIFSGLERVAERRRYPRYPASAPLEIDVDGATMECRLDNVSAGGVRLTPAVTVHMGAMVTVRHSSSGLALQGRVVGQDDESTRVQFDSEDAGIVVSSWLRMASETDGGEGGQRSRG